MNANLEEKLNTNGAFGDEFFKEMKMSLKDFNCAQFLGMVKQLSTSDSQENKKNYTDFIMSEVSKLTTLLQNGEILDGVYAGFLSLILDALDIYPISDKSEAIECVVCQKFKKCSGELSRIFIELLQINNFNITVIDNPFEQLGKDDFDSKRIFEKIDEITKKAAIDTKEKGCNLFILDLTAKNQDAYTISSIFKAFKTYHPECRIVILQYSMDSKFATEYTVIYSYTQIFEFIKQILDDSGKLESASSKSDNNDYVVENGELTYLFAKSDKITIPDNVKIIGAYAIENKSIIAEVEIPDSVQIIRDHAFDDCYELISISIPDSVTEIGELAFCYCTRLKSVRLSKSLKTISERMFMDCVNLSEIEIPDGVKEIGSCCFEGDAKLESIQIPNSVKVIGERAFFRCKSLKEIVIPASVKEIGESAFFDCTGLEKVTFLGKKPKLGLGAFSSCKNLKRIEFIGKCPRKSNDFPQNAETVEIQI